MSAYTLNYITIDNGDPQCDERKRFDSYISSYWEKGCQITTNIKNYEILIDKKSDNLFEYSKIFFSMSIYNAFALTVIQLAAFFSDSDTASIPKFLNYCEQNQKQIFTKEFYEEKINVPNSRIKVDMGKFSDVLTELRTLLNEKENIELIELIKNNRDKVFAHFDKDFLVAKKWQLSITIDDLKKGVKLVETVINKVGSYYDRSYRSFEPIDISGIKNTIEIIDFYKNNKEQIRVLKNDGVLK